MFYDAQDIQHNIQACKQIQNEGPNAQERESEYEKKGIDWDLEHRIENTIGPLAVSNANDSAKIYIPPVERGGVDPSHDKQKDDCFMYLFIDSQEDEFTNQFVEEQVDVPSFFLLDDIAQKVDLPVYDKYEEDCDVEDFIFQQYSGINKPTYHSYKEKSIESVEENSLPLCFVAFKLLKENS
jgi:hypothetical protein